MSVAVMRSPCLMEDEGRPEFIRTFATRSEAEHWISKQENEYFKPQDYYLLESVYCSCEQDWADGTPICQACGKERK